MTGARLLTYTATVVAFFVIGFLSSLGIHWVIRPSATVQQPPIDTVDTTAFAAQDLPVLQATNDSLKATVTRLENDLAKAEVTHSINEGHARALIVELQTYRQERDKLFADLERRKQKMVDKLEELDEKIQTQMALRDDRLEQQSDYEIANELTSLLSYPHPLNDVDALNSALLAQPKHNSEFVEQRFELMLQPEAYTKTDQLYEVLAPMVAGLNKAHDNNTTLVTVHCSATHCEIQTRMDVKQPYFDYWQEWLVLLRSEERTKLLQQQFSAENGNTLLGSVIIATR